MGPDGPDTSTGICRVHFHFGPDISHFHMMGPLALIPSAVLIFMSGRDPSLALRRVGLIGLENTVAG